MEQLNKIASTIRTTEINTLASGLVSEFESANLNEDAFLINSMLSLKTINLRLTEAVNRIKAESNLEEKDEIRDAKVKAIYYLVMGFVYHPDLSISEAAKKLNAVLEHYGLNIISESYAVESSLIESLLLELGKEELQPSILLLPGLVQLIIDLRASQTALTEAQLVYQNEKASDGTKENGTEIKKELLAIINEKLIVYLRAMIMVDEVKYGQFVGVAAQLIDDMNIIIKKRKKTAVQETQSIN